MSTYLVYVLNSAKALAPTVSVAYVQADKYGPAWGAARQLLNDGKPHKDAPTSKQLFDDAEGKVPSKIGFGDHLTVAKIVDIKPRNVKMDKKALQAILADDKSTAEEKLAAMKAMVG